MSANIQFIETGNLLSSDKGYMSGFLAPPCIARCVGGMLAGCRWTAVVP